MSIANGSRRKFPSTLKFSVLIYERNRLLGTDYNRRKNNKNLYPLDEDKEYMKKIARHKKKKKITMAIIITVVLLACLAVLILYYFQQYSSYEVMETTEHSNSTYVRYETVDDLQIRYTRDGISLFENQDRVIWSTTYEMQNPVLDTNGDYVIVYEENANKIYLFNLEKHLCTYETTMPIKKACVSEKGTVALLVYEGEQVHRIQYIDSSGEMIAEGRTFFSQKGYPLDMSLSNDGYKLCISYYSIDGAATGTNIVFHSFDDIGDSNIDNIVTDDYYSDEVIPIVKFLEDDTLLAFGDSSIIIYNNEMKPSVKNTIKTAHEISSVFYDKTSFGTVTTKDNKHTITVYAKSGRVISEFDTKFDYSNISMESGKILLNNSTGWEVYFKNGYLKAEGSYSQEITQMISVGLNHYMIVGNDCIEKIRLSK